VQPLRQGTRPTASESLSGETGEGSHYRQIARKTGGEVSSKESREKKNQGPATHQYGITLNRRRGKKKAEGTPLLTKRGRDRQERDLGGKSAGVKGPGTGKEPIIVPGRRKSPG